MGKGYLCIMKNIAILCRTLNTGGAERIAGLLSKKLSKKYNVYLFLIDSEKIVYEYGGTIIDIGSYGSSYESTIKSMKVHFEIDVAISFLIDMNFVNLRTRGKERVILSERSTLEAMVPKALSAEYKVQNYYNAADGIVACSDGTKYSLVNTYGVDESIITTIYNFIDKESILEKAVENFPESIQSFIGESRYFVNVGRLHPVKNQERLIRQFYHFHKYDENETKLLIVGSGEKYNELIELIEQLKLQNYVRIVPYCKNPFMYIARAKALIVSSYSEGLPNVVLEAMLLQCPVIATDCLSGPRELLKGTTDYQHHVSKFELCERGILVCNDATEDRGDTFFMASAMRCICENVGLLAEIKKNQALYMSRYTNEKILQEWIEVIEKEDKKAIDIYEIEKKLLETAEHIYIYGAGKIGIRIYERLNKDINIEAFIVTKKVMQQDNILGLPVKELDDVTEDGENAVFIISVAGRNQDEIINELKKRGLDNIVFPFN